MNVNTFSCTVHWELLTRPLPFLLYFTALRRVKRSFTWLAELHKVTQLHLSAPERPQRKKTNLLLCHREKCQSQMKTVNHPVGAIEVLSGMRFRQGSNSVWKIFKDFSSTGFSFIQFHLFLLSSIFQLFTDLE